MGMTVMMMRAATALLVIVTCTVTAAQAGPVVKPSPAHLAWHEDTFGVVIHFNMQTFVEPSQRRCPNKFPLSTFNPEKLNTTQWMEAASQMGAKYAVLVVDHFSGFNLWASQYSNYSVSKTPWRSGKDDILSDFLKSTHDLNIKPGIYYSLHENWNFNVCDFNTSDPSAQPAFDQHVLNQLKELTSIMGDRFTEMWFDAGVKASQTVTDAIDTIAQGWPQQTTCHSCGALPHANGVSWMGNEHADMPYPNWGANAADCSNFSSTHFGDPRGVRYCPAHCDAVLREHYWFWQNGTESKIRTMPDLIHSYFTSVGRGCNLILDMAPDDTGLIPAEDVAAYKSFGDALNKTLSAVVYHNDSLPASESFVVSTPKLNITRGGIEIREYLNDGQMIGSYVLRMGWNGQMSTLPVREPSLTVGNRRIQTFASEAGVAFDSLAFTITESLDPSAHLRSLKVFDWSNSSFDEILSQVF